MPRRVEYLIDEIRQNTENELPTAGDVTLGGITDESIVLLLNRAQDRLYSRLMMKYPNMFLKEKLIDSVSGTEAYSLNTDTFLENSVVMVEWMYSGTESRYTRLPKRTIHERYTDENGTPLFYIVKNDTILINPIPDVSRTSGIRVQYYRKPLALDKRRGYVKTASKTGNTLTSLTLEAPANLQTKDANLDVAANAVLTTADYVCIVDKDGVSVLESIPVVSYNTTTRVLTMASSFSTTLTAATLQNNYIVLGYSATTHTELPDSYERYLRLYAEQAIFRRDGNVYEANSAFQELSLIEQDIVEAGGQKTDTFDTPLDEHWLGPEDIWI